MIVSQTNEQQRQHSYILECSRTVKSCSMSLESCSPRSSHISAIDIKTFKHRPSVGSSDTIDVMHGREKYREA